jgi:hypothetical protein
MVAFEADVVTVASAIGALHGDDGAGGDAAGAEGGGNHVGFRTFMI